MRKQTVVRLAVFAATTVAAWAVLSFGAPQEDPSDLQPGQVAERDYRVVEPGPVTNTAAFEQAQQAAREEVEPVTVPRDGVEEEVLDNIEGFFADLRDAVIRPTATPTTTTEPEATTTSSSSTTSTTAPPDATGTTVTTTPPTTVPVESVEVSGLVFIDADGNGRFEPDPTPADPEGESPPIADVPLPMVGVVVESDGGGMSRVESQSDGTWTTTVPEGEISVAIDRTDPEFPGFPDSTGTAEQTLQCGSGEACQSEAMGFAPELIPVDAVVAGLSTVVPDESVEILARVAREDVVRTAVGGEAHLAAVQQAAIGQAEDLFSRQIFETPTDEGISLEEARIIAAQQPPLVFYDDGERDADAGAAAGQVVASLLRANWTIDEQATEAARAAAAQSVDESEYQQIYQPDQIIASAGEVLTQSDIDAILQTGGVLDRAQRQGGLLAVLTILSGVLALYLNRFRPEFWAKPRMVALLGILLVFASVAVRLTVFFEPEVGWYVMPAVAFGLMTTVLFDARIGVLMALAMAILTAAGTRDPGVTVYALMATMAPIAFVSSISSRRAFRNAAVYSAVTAAIIAAATSWLFHTGPQDVAAEVVGWSTAWAFGVSLVAALLGLALLQFFESAFDITTTLTLLDLTDRNHEALQLLQEKAFGTFNHSLMVGTLADAAARGIGANPLLARASAYYHDLGKTENPTFFIENQFGIANPHDELTPVESAEVIRRHVTDGVRLAKRFKIPAEVAEGIVSHHGDAIMRYFYEKARSDDPDVDPDLFRHIGHKPRTAETAILMLADSLEASCRAVFQNKEPTPEAIEELVGRVVDEKVNDGQLSESPLTLAQLTETRKAFIGSLVGHYHQRITYPNFPGS